MRLARLLCCLVAVLMIVISASEVQAGRWISVVTFGLLATLFLWAAIEAVDVEDKHEQQPPAEQVRDLEDG